MKFLRDADGNLNTQVVVAVIGASATLLAALIAGSFGLIQLRANTPSPDPTTAPSPTFALLTVEIEGPTEALLDEQTIFTILSEAAVRAEWTIPEFGSDDINPFRQAEQVFVEPDDADRVGESFTLVVTVYDADGNRASARHRFQVVDTPSTDE